VKLVASGNLCFNFPPQETDHVHGVCCMLILFGITCCNADLYSRNLLNLDFSDRETGFAQGTLV